MISQSVHRQLTRGLKVENSRCGSMGPRGTSAAPQREIPRDAATRSSSSAPMLAEGSAAQAWLDHSEQLGARGIRGQAPPVPNGRPAMSDMDLCSRVGALLGTTAGGPPLPPE
mmetsp:Transcript_25960/g.73368  ORF Transcript_25960/g.73368 Transcript_25960/m.73368 type:complete len:113 (-) Transcript_25960:160-498(-)